MILAICLEFERVIQVDFFNEFYSYHRNVKYKFIRVKVEIKFEWVRGRKTKGIVIPAKWLHWMFLFMLESLEGNRYTENGFD